MGFVMKTVNGYDFYEATSSLQKAIRRCEEDEAVFWAIELFESNYVGHVWNRLFIIASEDIGLAEPNFTQKLIALKAQYDYLEKHRPKKLSKRLVFLQTVIEFARAKKSRYVDLAYMVYWYKHQERVVGKQIPEYAFDMHTRRGKAMNRGVEHFYEEGAKINNRAEIEGEREFEQLAKMIDIEASAKPSSPETEEQEEKQPDLFGK